MIRGRRPRNSEGPKRDKDRAGGSGTTMTPKGFQSTSSSLAAIPPSTLGLAWQKDADLLPFAGTIETRSNAVVNNGRETTKQNSRASDRQQFRSHIQSLSSRR